MSEGGTDIHTACTGVGVTHISWRNFSGEMRGGLPRRAALGRGSHLGGQRLGLRREGPPCALHQKHTSAVQNDARLSYFKCCPQASLVTSFNKDCFKI